jgi:multimeric flavodoxin WrbA
MKVIGIATTPRKGGNSQALVEHILAGAKKAGAKTELVRISDLDIKPCLGCGGCKRQDGCVQKDDFAGLVKKLAAADAVVFGSPLYWGRMNAQAYPFIDRCYSLLKADFSTEFPKGKKLAFAMTSGGMGAEAMDPVNGYVKHVFSFLGFTDGGFIWQNQCYQLHDLEKFPDKIKEAEMIGAALKK